MSHKKQKIEKSIQHYLLLKGVSRFITLLFFLYISTLLAYSHTPVVEQFQSSTPVIAEKDLAPYEKILTDVNLSLTETSLILNNEDMRTLAGELAFDKFQYLVGRIAHPKFDHQGLLNETTRILSTMDVNFKNKDADAVSDVVCNISGMAEYVQLANRPEVKQVTYSEWLSTPLTDASTNALETFLKWYFSPVTLIILFLLFIIPGILLYRTCKWFPRGYEWVLKVYLAPLVIISAVATHISYTNPSIQFALAAKYMLVISVILFFLLFMIWIIANITTRKGERKDEQR